MKKLIILGIVCVFFVFSAIAFADDAQNYLNHENDDGIIIQTTIDEAYNNLPYIHNRTGGYYLDVNQNGQPQSTELLLNAQAYIPCYLKMTLTGNTGKTTLESFGPNADAYQEENKYSVLFDNEVGGFVNDSWEVVGHGKNAEIAPGTGNFIRACDQFKVELYGNDTFKYVVISEPLTTNDADVSSASADKTLDIQMRTKVDAGVWGATWSFGSNQECLIGQRAACESMVALHDFRVPYLKSTAHGRYGGYVIFRAFTI
jgi:hypothetical protein